MNAKLSQILKRAGSLSASVLLLLQLLIPISVSAENTLNQVADWCDPNPQGGYFGVKFDPPVDGTIDGITADFTTDDSEVKSVTVTSTANKNLTKVVVKGGNDAEGGNEVYSASPFTNLTAPVNPKNPHGKRFGISHVIVCYEPKQEDTSPTLHVTKHVLNDNEGTAMASDFKLYVNDSLLDDPRKGGGDVDDSSVTYLVPNVVAGTSYEVTEEAKTGYQQTGIVCKDTATNAVVTHPVVLTASQSIECTVTNNDVPPVTPTGSLKVSKSVFGGDKSCDDFHFTVNGGDPIKFTKDGDFCTNIVTGLALDGVYDVVEVEANQYGYVTSYSTPVDMMGSTCSDIPVTNEYLAFCMITNTYPLPLNKLGGVKFNDADKDGNFDEDEDGIAGWKINLLTCSKEETDCSVVKTATTDTDGSYLFEDLEDGIYKVCEQQVSGWTQTYPFMPAGYEPGPEEFIYPTSDTNSCWLVPFLGLGYDINFADFGNFNEPEEEVTPKKGSISGFKLNDANGNMLLDEGEEKLSGWTIQLYGECRELDVARLINIAEIEEQEEDCFEIIDEAVTDSDGNYAFTDLSAGTYYVCEVQQAGWVRTFPEGSDCHEVDVDEGEDCIANFANKAQTPGKVLGETAPTPTPPQVLANTGSSMIQGLLVGVSILGAAGGVSYLSRRKQYTY